MNNKEVFHEIARNAIRAGMFKNVRGPFNRLNKWKRDRVLRKFAGTKGKKFSMSKTFPGWKNTAYDALDGMGF